MRTADISDSEDHLMKTSWYGITLLLEELARCLNSQAKWLGVERVRYSVFVTMGRNLDRKRQTEKAVLFRRGPRPVVMLYCLNLPVLLWSVPLPSPRFVVSGLLVGVPWGPSPSLQRQEPFPHPWMQKWQSWQVVPALPSSVALGLSGSCLQWADLLSLSQILSGALTPAPPLKMSPFHSFSLLTRTACFSVALLWCLGEDAESRCWCLSLINHLAPKWKADIWMESTSRSCSL